MPGESWAYPGDKAFFKQNQIKNVTRLHQQIKFILRHYLAEPAETLRFPQWLVVPCFPCRYHVPGTFVADKNLIWQVFDRFLKAAKKLRQLNKIIRGRVYNPLGRLGSPSMNQHIRRMDKHKRGTF
jgi:hypothetical protein